MNRNQIEEEHVLDANGNRKSGFVRVPLHLADAAQREVAEHFGTAERRPTGLARYADADYRSGGLSEERLAHYRGLAPKTNFADAPRQQPSVLHARDAAYEAKCRRLEGAWRRCPAEGPTVDTRRA